MDMRRTSTADADKKQAGGKRPYASPKLAFYGDVRALTRSGSGSQTEPTNSGQGSPQKRP